MHYHFYSYLKQTNLPIGYFRMQQLTDVGHNLVNGIASRYGLSQNAVLHMLIAVNNGGGSMAQFNSPELGGSGQWMRGGMTMVGDMFNYGLKSTVDNLCNELSNVLSSNQVFPTIPAGTPGSNQWWPGDLGSPFSSGAQNNIRYAIFPNRLAVELNGLVSVYDTLDHNIGGVSQQQGSNTSLTFSSQWGTINVDTLPLISGIQPSAAQQDVAAHFTQQAAQSTQQAAHSTQQVVEQNSIPASANNVDAPVNTHPQYSTNETLQIIEKLAQLRDSNALSDEEFNSKKSELLKRL